MKFLINKPEKEVVMVERVDRSNGGNSSYKTSPAALKEKIVRTEFKDNKIVLKEKIEDTQKLEKMERAEGKVTKLPVPTDYTSPAFLQRVSTQFKSKATQVKSATKEASAYISGKGSLSNLITSVSKTQKSL